MLESTFEQKVVREVKNRGGLCLKWVCPGVDGVPDRICLFPGPAFIFLELKRPGRADGLSKRQKHFLEQLASFGFVARKINSIEELHQIFEELNL